MCNLAVRSIFHKFAVLVSLSKIWRLVCLQSIRKPLTVSVSQWRDVYQFTLETSAHDVNSQSSQKAQAVKLIKVKGDE